MDRARPLLLLTALAILGAGGPALAQSGSPDPDVTAPQPGGDERPLAIGDRVGRLRFTDIRYLPRRLDELGERAAYVLVFVTTDCPLARRYLGKLRALDAELAPRGVQLVAVNVGPGDGIVDLAAQALEHDLPFPAVKDWDAAAARALGVTRTPEAVVIDRERVLRYRGRIDGQYRLGGVAPSPGREDLREAIEDVLAGRPVREPEVPAEGCLIVRPAPVAARADWARDVAPIVARHCQECHRPGTEAPFPLLTAADVRDHSDTVAEVLAQGRMPPWFASPAHGEWHNRRGLSAAERDTLLAWIDAGCPAPAADAPPPPPPAAPEATTGWAIGQPDLELPMLAPYEVPAAGYVPYHYALYPYLFAEDTWVEAIEIRPEHPEVVHHANLAYVQLGQEQESGHFLTGRVPGGGPSITDPGVAYLIPAGSLLVLQIHYVTVGRPVSDRISIGLRFPRQPVRRQLRHLIVENKRFEIPPGAPHHEVRAAATLPTEAAGIGLFSHMHLRGKDMTFVARYPDGRRETLLSIPNYSFDWQLAYRWAPGTRTFPAGTRIETVGHFDNSAWNPYNPDPAQAVRFGQQTFQEMFYGFLFYTDPGERLDVRVDPRTGHALPAAPPRPRWH